ncbi:hypothetical protein [Lysinibacillus sp. TE18511]
MRKSSGSNKCFICAKAKRQQQLFYLCESEAAATTVLSVRKRSGSNNWILSVRKRSGSNNCFICAKAKRQQQLDFVCAKAKRQRQMFYLCESEATATKRPVGTEINPLLQ